MPEETQAVEVEQVEAPVESATTEETPVETEVNDSEVEQNTTEEKTEDRSIPYDRFQEVLKERNYLREQAQAPQESYQGTESSFDEDTEKALEAKMDSFYSRRRAEEKQVEFRNTHAEDLQDIAVSGTFSRLMAEAISKGHNPDPAEVLSDAKALLDSRVSLKMKETAQQSFNEGQEIAQKKQQAGAVGISAPAEKVDVNTMTAKQLAEYYKIPTAN